MKHKPETQLPNGNVNTATTELQPQGYEERLLAEFIKLLGAHRWVFKQERSFSRCAVLILGMIFAFARHTVTQCVLSIGQGGRDWSAWYRLFSGKRFKQDDLDEVLLQETLKHVPEDQPYLVVTDGTQTAHTSKNMPGCGLGISHRSPAFARGLHLCRRWVTCAWLPPIVDGFSRAIPLKFLDAFTPKSAPASVKPRSETAATLVFLDWLRARLDGCKRSGQWIVALADGAFDTKTMWKNLPERVVLIVRTAKNRALCELPGQYVGKWRPRQYGAAVPTPQQRLKERFGWKHQDIKVRGRIKHMRFKIYGAYLRKEIPTTPMFLLVIDAYRWAGRNKSGRRVSREREEVFYLISAVKRNGIWELPYPAETLLQWAWQRWEVEVTHRDLKAGFGIGQMQCWGQVSSVMATRWGVWVFALMLLSAYRAWGWQVPFALNCAWWGGAQRWSFNTVWRYFRAALWKLPTFRALAGLSGATAEKVAAAWPFLAHSVLAAARA